MTLYFEFEIVLKFYNLEASFYGDVVECLISDPEAWVQSPAGEKAISIFSPVAILFKIRPVILVIIC